MKKIEIADSSPLQLLLHFRYKETTMNSLPLALGLASLIGGLFIVMKGADWLVSGASVLARKIGMSELMIGLTVVAFGTSLPELTVNIFSSFNGATDIAIGNVVGSNIANILLILGVTAVIAPLHMGTSTVWKEIPLSLLAGLVLLTMANDHLVDGYAVSELSRSDGLTLIAFFSIFMWYTFGMKRAEEDDENEGDTFGFLKITALITGGLVLLVVGGKLTVDGAVTLASAFGISEALIGLTLVAIGTSVPELATCIVAARRGNAGIAVGNILGSNIFNIFWILGLSSAIHPLPFSPSMNIDIGMILFSTIALFFIVHNGQLRHRLFFWKQRDNHVIARHEGVILLVAYGVYLAYLVWRG